MVFVGLIFVICYSFIKIFSLFLHFYLFNIVLNLVVVNILVLLYFIGISAIQLFLCLFYLLVLFVVYSKIIFAYVKQTNYLHVIIENK